MTEDDVRTGPQDAGPDREEVLWPAWQELWPPTRAALEEVLAPLAGPMPELTVRPGAFANPAYPLSTSLSLNVTGPPWDEDVVLSAAVRAAGDEFRFDSDICTGDGQYLAEQPRRVAVAAQPEEALLAWARECLDGYVAFVRAELGLVADQLEAARRTR